MAVAWYNVLNLYAKIAVFIDNRFQFVEIKTIFMEIETVFLQLINLTFAPSHLNRK